MHLPPRSPLFPYTTLFRSNYAASGSIDLNTSGLLQMTSGYGAEAYTLVGHGGYGNGGTANYGLAGESIAVTAHARSEEHTSELQSRPHLVCRLLLEKKNKG